MESRKRVMEELPARICVWFWQTSGVTTLLKWLHLKKWLGTSSRLDRKTCCLVFFFWRLSSCESEVLITVTLASLTPPQGVFNENIWCSWHFVHPLCSPLAPPVEGAREVCLKPSCQNTVTHLRDSVSSAETNRSVIRCSVPPEKTSL